jgi:hypothetical protein
MATTSNTYTGNGSNKLFSITFPYLDTSDIDVYLNGTLQTIITQYTFANATTVEFVAAPANGAVILLDRSTDDATLQATFFPGSSIKASDLNDDFDQVLYIAQETSNEATTATTTAATATTTANTALSQSAAAVSTANTASSNASAAVSTANTASTNASNAVTTANTASSNATTAVNTANAATSTANTASSNASAAVSTANTASSNASAAVSTANTASSNASAAVSTANAANSTANTASGNASTAVTTANNAVTTANTANSNSNTAVTTANAAAAAVANAVLYTTVANVAAIPGSPANNAAVEVTNSTGIESFTPLSGLPAGFIGSSGLSVRIIYQTSGATWTWIQYFPNDPETRYLKLAGGTLTGTLAHPLGAAATPSITFTGDTNTGIYSPAADQVAISTGGTVRLTSSTTAISSALPIDVPLASAATPSLTFTGDPNTGIFSPGADTLAITTAGTNRLHITSGGLVGIGASSPSTKLEVSDGSITAGSSGDVLIGRNSLSFPSPGAGYFKLGTNNLDGSNGGLSIFTLASDSFQERVRVDSLGRVGIGVTPSQLLHINSTGTSAILRVSSGSAGVNTSTSSIQLSSSFSGSGVEGTAQINANAPAGGQSELAFLTSASGNSPTERARIDSSGRLGIGTSTVSTILNIRSNSSDDGILLEKNDGTGVARLFFDGTSSDARLDMFSGGAAKIQLKANGDSHFSGGRVGIGSSTPGRLLQVSNTSGDPFISILGAASNNGGLLFGDNASDAAGQIRYGHDVDAMYFSINGAERFRCDSSGRLLVGTSTYSFSSGGIALLPTGQVQATKNADFVIEINRTGNDGGLVRFYQDTVEEGNISVSGTTVSYNGAHLSRWSQLPTGAEREEILRGTLLSNLDEMCEWGEEDNEQLNRMKVSEVEGDKNVSGVFQAWDDDDDTYTNDFYCAMTGDFIIRIAEGVTVERGDLLMSAGDGTAKPQDDDIIRSKTIAKVTSTNVSCTYEDGSYCVPCVLMAC